MDGVNRFNLKTRISRKLGSSLLAFKAALAILMVAFLFSGLYMQSFAGPSPSAMSITIRQAPRSFVQASDVAALKPGMMLASRSEPVVRTQPFLVSRPSSSGLQGLLRREGAVVTTPSRSVAMQTSLPVHRCTPVCAKPGLVRTNDPIEKPVIARAPTGQLAMPRGDSQRTRRFSKIKNPVRKACKEAWFVLQDRVEALAGERDVRTKELRHKIAGTERWCTNVNCTTRRNAKDRIAAIKEEIEQIYVQQWKLNQLSGQFARAKRRADRMADIAKEAKTRKGASARAGISTTESRSESKAERKLKEVVHDLEQQLKAAGVSMPRVV